MYRVYVTDALKAIGNLNTRYADWVLSSPIDDDITSEEVVANIRDGLAGMGG